MAQTCEKSAGAVAHADEEAAVSGVLYTALAFGKPLVLSAVGGFARLGA